jgi:hypothetical protein
MATAKKSSTSKAATKMTAAKKVSAKKKPPATIQCGKWTAVHDHMPPGTPTLRVNGVCKTPTSGYRIKLVPAVPQGINPKILLLKKIVTPPKGIVPPIVTAVAVKYEKKTKFEYTNVAILPDGVTIKVKEIT